MKSITKQRLGLLTAALIETAGFGMETMTAMETAWRERKFELTRRLALAELNKTDCDPAAVRYLILSARMLGDPDGADRAAAALPARTPGEIFERARFRAENALPRAAGDQYRGSAEERSGLSPDEYRAKHRATALARFREALAAAKTPEQRRELGETAAALRRKYGDERALWDELARDGLAFAKNNPKTAISAKPAEPARHTVFRGILRDAAGTPMSGMRLEMQFSGAIPPLDPNRIVVLPDCGGGIGNPPPPNPGAKQYRAETDGNGAFEFPAVPAGHCDYLALLPPPGTAVYPVRFLRLDFPVSAAGGDNPEPLEFRVSEWTPAPPEPPAEVPKTRIFGGKTLGLTAGHILKNPFCYRFPRQFMHLPLPPGEPADNLLLFGNASPEPIPFQVVDGAAGIMAELPPYTVSRLGFYRRDGVPAPRPASRLQWRQNPDGSIEIETGAAAFRLGNRSGAPLTGVRGPDGVWRGGGRIERTAGGAAPRLETRIVESGPVVLRAQSVLDFGGGRSWRYNFEFHTGEPYALVREESVRLDGENAAWVLEFPEYTGERGFRSWTAEDGGVHYFDLPRRAEELARIQEQVQWWSPRQLFGFGLSFNGLNPSDSIGVFSLRRGEWRDDDFAKIAFGPGDASEQRELDWPYPEMVGSTLSMITVHTGTGGVPAFRFGGFNGERRWGILATDFAENDGPYRALSLCQHKNSSPRLEEFRKWTLDAPETLPRPRLLTTRARLDAVRAGLGREPYRTRFAELPSRGPGSQIGVRPLLEQNAAELWRYRHWILRNADIRPKMVLQGRDYGDVYSPVGGRPITPMAAAYDLLAPTGMFAAAEERRIRAGFMAVAHMYLEPDFMNWKFGSRNANFEADRVDIVGTVGLVFSENPDSREFLDHAAGLMRRAFEVYTTPGSGKWYENPACYYLHASSCRLNLVYNLWRQGVFDSSGIERLKDFLRWGILLLTPRAPVAYDPWCRPGDWFGVERGRLVPPIGDHAQVGARLGDFYWLLAPMYDRSDPAFANLLRWAWQEARHSENGVGSPHLLLFAEPPPPERTNFTAPPLESRRLAGFGTVTRANFGTDDELYVLFKLGPGGYRFHRTEGAFLYCAHGRPLVWDGGEAGETWRHATLSFGASRMPLAPGHIERFSATPEATFSQGVNPCWIRPGEPVFLSDSCEHDLVSVARARFAEKNPLNHRSVLAVGSEYLVVHDDLAFAAAPPPEVYWNLPVVAESVRASGPGRWRFAGRFGVDLELSTPGAELRAARDSVLEHEEYGRRHPAFSMCRLELEIANPGVIAAVLRPLRRGTPDEPLDTVPLYDPAGRQIGIKVENSQLCDWIFLSRRNVEFSDGPVTFRGRYGMVRRGPGGTFRTLRFDQAN